MLAGSIAALKSGSRHTTGGEGPETSFVYVFAGQWLWVMLFLVVAQLIHSSVVTLPLFSIISQV